MAINKPLNSDSFDMKVIWVVQQIPYGKVTTYGAIAEFLGSRSAARMVGWVLNRQKTNANVPAHRVVNRSGMLTGKMHFEGTDLMQQLLQNEGVQVVANQVDLDRYFWNPNELKKKF